MRPYVEADPTCFGQVRAQEIGLTVVNDYMLASHRFDYYNHAYL